MRDSLAFAGELAAGLVAEFDVAPHRHPVTDIIGEQRQPLVVTALIEDFGFGVEEFGDLLGEEQPRYAGVAHVLLRSSTPAIASSTRATTGKPSCPQPCA
jgi:hypothetical protein